MKNFLRKLGWFTAIQLVFGGAILWLYSAKFPRDQNFLGAAIDKHQLIATQASPRLILVGGSSMAFGVKSAPIAEACGRHPVNMGLHAYLGLIFMLAEVEPYLRAGDWVVVSPEYQQFVSPWGQSEYMLHMVEIDSQNLRLLRTHHFTQILDQGALLRAGNITRAVLGRPARWFQPNAVAKKKLYHRRAGFNENGDITAHLSLPGKGFSEDTVLIEYRKPLVKEAIDELNRFARLAEKRGAKVFFSHPPVPEEMMEKNREPMEKLENDLAKGLVFPRIDTLDETAFPRRFFFDTAYHLAVPGVEMRTELLTRKLREQYERSLIGK